MTINAELWLINSIKTSHELFIELKARLSLFVLLWHSQIMSTWASAKLSIIHRAYLLQLLI